MTKQPAGADPGSREPASQPGDDQQQRPASQPQAAASRDATGEAPRHHYVNPGPQRLCQMMTDRIMITSTILHSREDKS